MSASSSSAAQFPPGYLEENHGGRAIAACCIVLVITSILFPLRLYARSLTPAQRAWDDHVLIPSYILLLGLIASVYAEVTQAGLGRHAAAVMMENPKMINKYLLLLYLLDWFYVPSNMLSRISVILLYLRIFTDRWARAACWAVMGFLIANCLATIIAAQLECTPLAYTWDRSIEGGKCFNQLLWYKLSNFPNIAGDVMIAILPIKTVWGLKASTARKAGIATVCLTGSIGLIASCARTSVFFIQGNVILKDPTFADEAFSWTVVECGMYFSAACLIGMRPLFARLPSFIKVHFLHESDMSGKESTFLRRSSEMLRRKGHSNHKSQDVDAEKGLRHKGQASVETIPGYYARDPFDVGGDTTRSEIRVETNIEVRSDFDWQYPEYNSQSADARV